MDVRPVCKGVSTDFLIATFGATISTALDSLVFTGPLPSIGNPIPSTTLPSNGSPTGTSITFPVPLTSVPSLIEDGSPRITIPTLSSSRFNAIPAILPSNSTSSLYETPDNPCTLAIPSPTSITVPILTVFISEPKSSIWLFNTEAISFALIAIYSSIFTQIIIGYHENHYRYLKFKFFPHLIYAIGQ